MSLKLSVLVKWFVGYLALSPCFVANAVGDDIALREKVMEAYDYLSVKPQITYQIIEEHLVPLQSADFETQLDAYLFAVWAGVYLSDQQISGKYSQKIIEFIKDRDVESQRFRIFRALSGSLWRKGNNQNAYLFAVCSLKYVEHPQNVLSSMLLMGATSWQSDKSRAGDIMKLGLKLANRYGEPRYIAAFLNNLGVQALGHEDYELAESYFIRALDIRYKTAHISGQVTSGTNLMLSYFLQQKWDLFYRVSHRIEVKLKNHNSPMYNHYYQWMRTAYRRKDLNPIPEETEDELRSIFDNIDQNSVQKYVAKAAELLGMDMGYQPGIEKPHEPELLELLPVCDWQLLQNMPVSELITHTKAAELFNELSE